MSDNLNTTSTSSYLEDPTSATWASSLASLSTPLLTSKLSLLSSQSTSLASALTAKLASSPSGQSLLHIGPSLSTLPPDLELLIQSLEPINKHVDMFWNVHYEELNCIVNSVRVVEKECVYANYCEDCKRLLLDLVAVENILYHSSFESDDNNNPDDTTTTTTTSDEELEYISSLERVAYTIVYLVQQLKNSTAQVTTTLSTPHKSLPSSSSSSSTTQPPSSDTTTNNNTTNTLHKHPNHSTLVLPTLDNHTNTNNIEADSILEGVETEKSHFLMKLAPRIRKLETECCKLLSFHLERLLHERMMFHSRHFTTTTTTTTTTTSTNTTNTTMNMSSRELLLYGHLFSSLALLGKSSESESIFARVAIMPILRSNLSIGKLDIGGQRGECCGLSLVLNDVLTSINTVWGEVIQFIESMFVCERELLSCSSEKNNEQECKNKEDEDRMMRRDVDLVTNSVWVSIAMAFMTDPVMKMTVFSPGIANIFQANYSTLHTFLSELAQNLLTINPSTPSSSSSLSITNDDDDESTFTNLYLPTILTPHMIQSAQLRLYSHSISMEFSKKWNLAIYFQLRFGEITSRLEEAIQQVQYKGWDANVGTTTTTTEGSSSLSSVYGFKIPFFEELYDILLYLWQPNVFLKPLTYRFLRGAIQLIGRVIAFVKDGLAGTIQFGVDTTNTNTDASNSNVQVMNGVESSLQYSWGEQIDQVATISFELMTLENCLMNHYLHTVMHMVEPTTSQSSKGSDISTPCIVEMTCDEMAELRMLISDLLQEVSQDISPIINGIWDETIVTILTTKCSAPLAAVKGVAATYRMTNRPPPTQASPFVATILRPLQEFDLKFGSIPQHRSSSSSSSSSSSLTKVNDNGEEVAVVQRWKRQVISNISEAYGKAVSELLETVQRTEEALKNRKARRTTTGGMSDGDKVKLQLYFDHMQFATSVEDVGVDPTSIEGMCNLASLTESAASLMST